MKKLLLPFLLTSTLSFANPPLPLTAGQWVIVNNSNCAMNIQYTVTQPGTYPMAKFSNLNLTAMSSNISNPIRTPFIYNQNPFSPVQTFNINSVTLCNVAQNFDASSCTAKYLPAMTKTFVFTLTPILGSTTVSCNVSAF